MVIHDCSCAHFVFGVKPVVENRKEANEKRSLLIDLETEQRADEEITTDDLTFSSHYF